MARRSEACKTAAAGLRSRRSCVRQRNRRGIPKCSGFEPPDPGLREARRAAGAEAGGAVFPCHPHAGSNEILVRDRAISEQAGPRSLSIAALASRETPRLL